MTSPAATSTADAVEHVLVVPTLLFHELGYFQGFHANAAPYLSTLLDPQYISYRPRDQMEQDPSFKQIIPYCLFEHEGRYFHYTRGKMQGEKRLHSKRSIGVGGHISSQDHAAEHGPYREALLRELSEEVHINAPYTETVLGLINDDATDVGKVHLGVVHLFRLERPLVSPREESMLLAGFSPLDELHAEVDCFESWSQICLNHLRK